MAKIINYPNNCSLEDSVKLAEIIKKAGGSAPKKYLAEVLGMSEGSGAFNSKIGSLTKYGFVQRQGDQYLLTELGKKYFFPIKDPDKREALLSSVKSVPIFLDILERCKGEEINKKILEAMLVRIFRLPKKISGKVAWYFFKANEKVSFLIKRDGVNFLVPEDILVEDKIGSDEKSDEKKQFTKKAINPSEEILNEEIFEILISLGKLLGAKGNKDDAVIKIKDILNKDKKMFSHAELFADGLEKENSWIINKIEEALRKDLGVKNNNQGPTVLSKNAEEKEDNPL